MTLKEKKAKIDAIVEKREMADAKVKELEYLQVLLKRNGFAVGNDVYDAWHNAWLEFVQLDCDLHEAIDEWCDEDYDIDQYATEEDIKF